MNTNTQLITMVQDIEELLEVLYVHHKELNQALIETRQGILNGDALYPFITAEDVETHRYMLQNVLRPELVGKMKHYAYVTGSKNVTDIAVFMTSVIATDIGDDIEVDEIRKDIQMLIKVYNATQQILKICPQQSQAV